MPFLFGPEPDLFWYGSLPHLNRASNFGLGNQGKPVKKRHRISKGMLTLATVGNFGLTDC